MKNLLKRNLAFLFPLIVLLPGLQAGGRTIYLFELILLAICVISITKKNVKLSKNLFYLSTTVPCVCLMLSLLQAAVFGSSSLSILRISVLLILVFNISKSCAVYSSLIKRTLLFSIAFAVMLAYAQIIDNLVFNGGLFVSNIVAKLFPYMGELGDRGINISGGLQLKTNSVFSPTSIVDGHTILAGNFFAVSAIIMLYWKKPVLFVATAIIAFLSFSRGSWLMLLAGIFYWLATLKWTAVLRSTRLVIPLKLSGTIVLAYIFIRNSIFWEYANFRIANTLYIFGLSQESHGTSFDPRTAHVWPQFISQMNEIGFHSWIIGSDLSIPTDSGILLLFRDSGIFGVLIVPIILLYGYFLSGKDSLVFCLLFVIAVGSLVNPVLQGYRLIYLFGLVVLVQSGAFLRRKDASFAG